VTNEMERPRLANDLPPPKPMTREEAKKVVEESIRIRDAVVRATEGMEGNHGPIVWLR